MDKVRVLFLPMVDADSVNAQSLNVREIALRFDAQRFQITLLHEREPDARLVGRSWIHLRQLPLQRKTARILREMLGGYDVIGYIDYSPASYVFLRLPRVLRKGAKAVFHAEAPGAQLVNPSRTLRFLYEGVASRCDVYTAITRYVARDVFECLNKKAGYILPVGVDTRFFTPPLQRHRTSPVVLFAGTLLERKGPQFLIAMAGHFPNAIFRLVGSGRGGFDEILQRKIADSGVRNMILDGPKTQSELVEIMRNSDIFVLPSRLEGMPKVTLEAAATGLPCVVFRDYETPSVLDGVTGFQVNTVEEMREALGKLIGDDSLRQHMGNSARKHVEQFDWDIVSKLWQEAYLEIAKIGAR